jgi:hypothetical protein
MMLDLNNAVAAKPLEARRKATAVNQGDKVKRLRARAYLAPRGDATNSGHLVTQIDGTLIVLLIAF